MDDNQFLQAVLPAAKGGLDVSSAFLASAIGAKDALSEIFGLEHVNGMYDVALKRWFELGKSEMAQSKKIGGSQFLTAKLQTRFYDSKQRM